VVAFSSPLSIRSAAIAGIVFGPLFFYGERGAAAPPVDAVIVFSEINYHPADDNDAAEWIEVQNAMGVSVDLSDWRITGGIDYVFPDKTVLAGGATLVVAKTPGNLPGSVGPFTGVLDNGGETLQLRDRNGRLMDEITYGDNGPWPVAADGSGATLAKRAVHTASFDPASWTFSRQSGGTPGAENFPPPSPPTITHVIAFDSAWRFENSGAAPAPNWLDPNFDDTAWSTGSGGFAFGNPTIYQDAAPNPVPLRTPITSLFNTGVLADGSTLATPGTNDLHFTPVTAGMAALVQTPHPAWLGGDGVSQWIGLTSNGVDNVQASQFVYRTTFNLNGWDPATAIITFFAAADNSLDAIVVNGNTRTVAASGFSAFLGPFTVAGPFNSGGNTIDFRWTNAGTSANPAGLRIKWDATAQPLLFRSTLPANPVTTYFRKKFSYSGKAGSTYRVLLNRAIDDGAIVYLNGQEIDRFNLPDGPVNSTTPASTAIVYPKFSGALDLPGSALLNGENVLAVELHQPVANDSDAVWIASLDIVETPADLTAPPPIVMNEVGAGGSAAFFLELQNTGTSPAALAGYALRSSSGAAFTLPGNTPLAPGEFFSLDAATLGFLPAPGDKLFLVAPGASGIADGVVVTTTGRARDGAGHWSVPHSATPGGQNVFDVNTAVVVNEIMFHHAPAYLPTGTIPSPEQWIELHNRTDAAVDLSGWKMRGGADFDFPAGTVLPARGHLVVSNDAQTLLAKFPGIPVIGNFSGSLSHADDVIRLEEPNGNTVNEVHYFGGGRWDARADGGGSSLELRDPDADNRVPEAWRASDESAKAAWQTFSYSGSAAVFPGSNDPTQYNEFIFGLLDAGEFLIDDVSVLENSAGNRQLIQNRDFTAGTTTWRLLGTHGSHGQSVVVDDPDGGGNKALHVVATGPTEHMHNHAETTLKNGTTYVPINPSGTYTISFRARWLSGSPRLQTRLYFNRLARQHLLAIPADNGSPGRANGALAANIGPAFTQFGHSPVLPAANSAVTVRAEVNDPDGVAAVTLEWRLDGGTWQTAPMTLQDGTCEGTIPGQAAGALVQFYVAARDGAGTLATFPAGGAASRAMVRWNDNAVPATPAHVLRVLMARSDADFMHTATNVMSNDTLPVTVVYREQEVFYDARIRLRSSERGRLGDPRLGFYIAFDPMHKFRGVHPVVNLDRSGYGRGTTGNGFGQSDIISWHFFNRAGGIPSMFNDLVYFVAPRTTHTGSSQLTMAEFNDAYLDAQYANGSETPLFKYELIYYPTTTTGGVEGLKLPQPDNVLALDIGGLATSSKEAYRWNYLISNARGNDDYSRIINLNNTFRMTGTAYAAALPGAVDVDQWLRAAAAMALAGVGDNFASSGGAWHNLKLYHRADGRVLYFPWDLDFQNQPANASLVINPDIANIFNASVQNQRLFYQHLDDIIGTSFNTGYLTTWVNHYRGFTTAGGNWNEITTYVNDRVNFARAQINTFLAPVNFAITTNGGADFNAPGPNVQLQGTGWLDVREIRVQGASGSLPVTWLNKNTWQVSVPIAPGVNTLVLQAINLQGKVVGTSTIHVTGTGNIIPAGSANLVVSELHYHPAPPTAAEIAAGFADEDDFEFVELQNISGTATINLAGVRFAGGIEYVFGNVTLGPRERVVIPRRTAAFALRHPGVATAPEYAQGAANSFDNSGEEVTIVSAGAATIQRFTYDDAAGWPTNADGTGPSLVLIAPLANPDPNDALHWRASATNEGNPGASDALPLPANPLLDDDGNGLSNLADYARGGRAATLASGTLSVGGVPYLTISIERQPLAEVNWKLESSGTPTGPWSDALLVPINREVLGANAERVTLRSTTPVTTINAQQFYRAHLSITP
jgi:hypothetical protein